MNTNEQEGRESLEEGRQIFEDWVNAMARAGEPLPPGGSCMASRGALMGEVYQSVRTTIAKILEIPPESVEIKISQGIDKGRHVDISIPQAEGIPEKEYLIHAERIMHEVHRAHMEVAEEAMEGFEFQARPELVHDVLSLPGFTGGEYERSEATD